MLSVVFMSFLCDFVLLFVTNVLKDSLNVSYCVRKVTIMGGKLLCRCEV